MSEIVGALFKYMMMLLGLSVVVGIFWNAQGVDKTGKVVSAQTELQANILDLYSSQSNFTSLSNTVLINARKVPDSMLAGTAIQNPWGGAVTVAVNSGNAGRFDITQTQLPPDACTKLATSNSRIVGLSINGTAQTIPVDAGSAASSCANSSNTLIFTVNR